MHPRRCTAVSLSWYPLGAQLNQSRKYTSSSSTWAARSAHVTDHSAQNAPEEEPAGLPGAGPQLEPTAPQWLLFGVTARTPVSLVRVLRPAPLAALTTVSVLGAIT